ncbi:MAG: CPBP family intramembrane metalloprotease [Paludibacter sp.]|nr:CPBP family intramembrane metalloprotease [Paludibacter sp.]
MTETYIHSKKQITLGIGLILFLFIAPIVLGYLGILKTNRNIFSLVIHELYVWFILFFVYIYATKIEKRKLLILSEIDISVKQTLKNIFRLILSFVGISITVNVILHLTGNKNDSVYIQKLVPILRQYKVIIPFIAITAGVVEELVFRAYLFPRFEELFKNTDIAIILSAALFGILHITYGTIAQVAFPFLFGVVTALHYKKHRNIKTLIYAHFLWDFLLLCKTVL